MFESLLDLMFFFPSIFNNGVTQSNQFLPSLQLTLHEDAQPRLRHTATALSLGPGRTQVIMFGGCPKWEWAKHDEQKPARAAVLEFSERTHMLNPGAPVASNPGFPFRILSHSFKKFSPKLRDKIRNGKPGLVRG